MKRPALEWLVQDAGRKINTNGPAGAQKVSHPMPSFCELVKNALLHARHRNLRDNTTLRALVGAAYLQRQHLPLETDAEAAIITAVSPGYIGAARILLQAEDLEAIADVLRGRRAIIPAAHAVRVRAQLINSFRHATPNDLKMFATTVGVATVFDEIISPQL